MSEQLLGDFKILRKIGEGTLGETYLAEQRFIKRPYVLKVLPSELSSDLVFIERFELEVSRLASLEHPRIVKVHTVSCVDNVYFLVTDVVFDDNQETLNLASYLQARKERLSDDEIFSVLHQVAEALDYAHCREGSEMAHLSLKPSNILLSRSHSRLEVMLSDFGLAKIIGTGRILARSYKALAEAGSHLHFTNERYRPLAISADDLSELTTSFLQTYAFLSPEQKGRGKIDSSSDVYAFGILAYYLISGTFPEGHFALPSEIAPEYQINFDPLVKECLQPKAEKRPKRLVALLDELKSLPKTAFRASVETLREECSLEGIKTVLKQEMVEIPSIKSEQVQLAGSYKKTSALDESALEGGVLQERVAVMTPVGTSSVKVTPYHPPTSSQEAEPIVKPFHPEAKECRVIEPILTELNVIAAGTYFRGSSSGNRDEMPRHKIDLHSFAIEIHPVTNEQFVRFLEFLGSEKDQNYNDLIRLKDSRLSKQAGRYTIEAGYPKHPVVGVTWYGALAYAKWIHRRLPTEAEWEIAALGGGNTLYPTGESIEKHQANFFSSDTTPVMSYQPNGYGLYDMAGNVYEWCSDWYGYNYYEASIQEPANPKGPVQGVYRVLRGGCWRSLKGDLRCSHRHRNNPMAVDATYGFRCVQDL